MDVQSIIAAVVGVVNAPIPQRPPALAPLAYLKYPRRELRSQLDPDGTLTICLMKWGWEYKRRGPRPPRPVPVDTAAVAAALADAGLPVVSVEDFGPGIFVSFGGIQQ